MVCLVFFGSHEVDVISSNERCSLAIHYYELICGGMTSLLFLFGILSFFLTFDWAILSPDSCSQLQEMVDTQK